MKHTTDKARTDRSPSGSQTRDRGSVDHRRAPHARAVKAIGRAGYPTLIAGVLLIVLAVGATAGNMALAPWLGLAAVLVTIIAVALLVISRRLAASDGESRVQQDPLQPEVTEEEEELYREHYRGE